MAKRMNNRNTNNSKPSRERKVSVKDEGLLLPFLYKLLNGQSKSSVKSMLAHGQIVVNGKKTTQFDDLLHVGDEVSVNYGKGTEEFSNSLMNIVWEDDYLIVINKKEGLLSVSNSHVQERTAYHILSDYVKKKDPRNKIFILHRLDRDTSGLMMFAKNVNVQHHLRSTWNDSITQRTYVAVVEGKPDKESDLLVSNLMENKQMQVYVTSSGDGKEAITRYHVINSNGRYSLLELDLETGRKNQIRVQMQSIGHPIAGDYKYGAETNPTGRLMLHAKRLFFIHPVTGEEMRFETRIPNMFSSLVR